MLTDLLAGQVQVAFDNLQSSLPHIKAGRLRAYALDLGLKHPAVLAYSDFVIL
jgi:tripartite-type tricarboxylate transporter receptor subunit TctC